MSAHHQRSRQKQSLSYQTLADAVAQARSWLDTSTHVLIGAGAGLSTAAGVDYADATSFATLFPALVRKGFRARYQRNIAFNVYNKELPARENARYGRSAF
jgi:NAD-dependent SIR2 family protein deacetylase